MPIIHANRLLTEVFGYPDFRPLQREIIASVLEHRDTLAVLPTGGGKSLCYQLPSLIFEGLTIVVSPLISLMQDQVTALTERGIAAAVLNSTLSRDEYMAVTGSLRAGRLRLLYLAPETLVKERTIELLSSLRVDCFTIDEAHCISEWGHDFRAEYRQLAGVREYFPDAVTLALTATATPRVRKDITRSLKMADPDVYVAGFDRANFFLEVTGKQSPDLQALEFIRERPGQAGIVYCLSRKNVDSLTKRLQESGINALPYHAGLSDEVRKTNQQRFTAGETDVIVATIAFGMGIDKPDIRFVLHYELPQDIESYYQQIGRAGRDGGPAHCRLLFGYGDVRKIRYFIEQRSEKEQPAAEMRLQAMLEFAQSPGCRRTPLLGYFGEKSARDRCGSCDNCASPGSDGEEMGEAARIILGCMVATGELFGAAHLVDVLHGNNTEKTDRHNHQRSEYWGGGKQLERGQWMELVRHLEHRKLVFRDPKYHGLKLTAEGETFLKGDDPLRIRLLAPDRKPRKKSPPPAGPGDVRVREALLRLRRRLSEEEGVPAYVIFTNRTLDALAVMLPRDAVSLLSVPGIGAGKSERYGEDILQTIRESRS